MQNVLEELVQSAELNIIDYDMHYRNELMTFNRVRPFYVMTYHKIGEARVRVGGTTYSITPETVTLIPPHIEHDHYKVSNEDTIFIWCHFTFQIANVINVLDIFQVPITFRLKNSIEFERVFLEFMELSKQSGSLSTTILKKAKAFELLYLLFEDIMKYKQNSFEKIQSEGFLSILYYIIQNPDKEITLKSLSEKYHLHPTYISNRFKELFGKSPIQVYREVRINKAKTLLKSSELSITNIASAVGFNDGTSFTRLFKMYVGISPTQYRNLNKKWVLNTID